MTVTQGDLFLAILALDAYNRGYNPGMFFPGSEDLKRTQIGDATILTADPDPTISFYAVAYSWADETVISYRGTTFESGPNWGDVLNGWTLSAGYAQASQAQTALTFYTQVLQHFAGGDGGQTIQLTGHSLGGGLAGFVSDLTGAPADVFNNIPFGSGVVAEILSTDLSQGMKLPLAVLTGYDPLTGQNYERVPSSSASVRQFITEGEIATGLRALTPLVSAATFRSQGLDVVTARILAAYGFYLDNATNSQTLHSNSGYSLSIPKAVALHSQALMVLELYANVNNKTDWGAIGPQLYDALFNDDVAKGVGFTKTASSGWYGPSARLMAAVAYSAIDSGVMPFGDTGIQSLFNDADTLGRLQTAGKFTGLISSHATSPFFVGSPAAVSPVGALSEIAVQFAADQARAASTDETFAQGAVELDGPVLKVDLDPTEWTSTFGKSNSNPTTTEIVGVGDLFNSVLANVSAQLNPGDPTFGWIASNAAGLSPALLAQLNKITEIDIALDGGDLSAAGTLPAAHGGSTGGAMLVGGMGQGSITGSDNGNDIIVGGATVTTGKGKDIILAGGTETITVGEGNNRIFADTRSMNLTMTYSGGAIGTSGGGGYGGGSGGGPTATASDGTDVIIGNLSGGDTFTFTDADRAAFTVVWGGAGNDTFNINTSSSSNVNIVELDMSGISGGNLANLDAKKLEDWVDQIYGLSPSDATIVILDPSKTDTLVYNGKTVDTPAATLGSTYWQNNDFADYSSDPKVINDETGGYPIGPDPKNPLRYLTEQKVDSYVQQAHDSTYAASLSYWYAFLTSLGLFPEIAAKEALENARSDAAIASINTLFAIDNYEAHNLLLTDTWVEESRKGTNNVLANANFEFGYSYTSASTREVNLQPIVRKMTSFGGYSDPTSPLEQHFASGGTGYLTTTGGGLNLINYNSGDFGIGVPVDSSQGTASEKHTTYEVLQGWAKVTALAVSSTTTWIMGTSPAQLGAVISNYSAPPNTPTDLYDPAFTDASHNRQTVSLSQFLIGSSASDPTNVSAQFFAANQALLDGQYYGFTVLDTGANVSTAIDALNQDSKLTGITLTGSGTPTLTLTAAQMSNDAAALGKITNARCGIAITDTAANVSQVFDTLNADATVTSIDLTDAAAASLKLNALQALIDTAALAKISNADYTIAISDTAADIAQTIDALNSDAAVRSITIFDNGTPALTLTVAQALGDTRALGEITNAAYSITVKDTAANILTNASALSGDGHVAGAVVVDTAANVLDSAAALNANAQVASITVVDTAANILADLTSIQANAKVTSIVVVDTAANVLANASALAGISDISGIGVADTAANVAANIDALNADASIAWVELTGSATPTMTLTAAQAVNDSSVLTKIANASYAVEVADTAAAVAANIDALAKVQALAGVTLTDSGTPTLTLTVAQAVNDAGVIAIISNSNAEIVVSDTAATVIAQLDALNADAKINAITLTAGGTPTLTLSVAQLLGDATALGKIDNANFRILVSDTAADVSANFDALNADAALSSITLTDRDLPMLILTAAQAAGDTRLLAKISNANYTIAIFDSVSNIVADAGSLASNGKVSSINAIDTVANILGNSAALANAGSTSKLISDTAANVAANIDAIKADRSIRAINLTDSGTPTLGLTVAQAIGDAAVLAMIANSTFAIDVSGTAADVSANINFLAANDLIGTVTLTDVGVPTLTLNAGEAAGDAAFLAKITNANLVVDVADAAGGVSANLDALNANAAIGAITLTDAGTPELDLTVAQALGDTHALGLITNASYTIAVTDGATNVVANTASLAADAHITSISIVDNAANVLAAAPSLTGNPLLTSITVVDTAANVIAKEAALAATYSVTAIDVVDTAANVAANLDALNADRSIANITLSDAKPVLTLTASQAVNDYFAFYKITNPSYSIAIVDTAADVSQYLGQLAYGQNLTSITLTDAGTPTLDLYSYLLDSGVLSKITNADYAVSLFDPSDIAVSTFLASKRILDAIQGGFGISDYASAVSANIDALGADAQLASITLADYGMPNLALSASQVIEDTQALGKITNAIYTISVTGSAEDILANNSAFAANGKISSLTVQDTAANVLSHVASLQANSAIAAIVVVDTAANVVASASALSVLTVPVSINVQDTAADVSALMDQLNADSSLSKITLTDAANPTLSLTAAQAVNDAIALGKIAGPSPYIPATYAIAIVDTAANVAQYIDALSVSSQVDQIASISLTDAQHLALTLDVAATLNDAGLLSLLANATYSVTVADTAANIERNVDGLNADPNISSVTVKDATVITVTAEQAVQDAAVLGKLVNATVHVVNTVDIPVDELLSQQSAIDSIGANFSILDTAANVSGNLAALNADPNLSAITLSDAGVPTLTLTAAQALESGLALGAITNTSYAIAVTDSAAAISADFTALIAIPQLSSITLSDPQNQLPLTVAELATGGALLGKITNWNGSIAISDTTTNIAADLDALYADPRVTSIFITDAATADMDLTVAQALETTALGKILNTSYGIVIIDTVDNIAANIDALSAISQIQEVAGYVPYQGIAPVPLTVDEAMRNRVLLSKGEVGLFGSLQPVPVAIVDSAANVAAALDLLNRDAGLTSITLTDAGTPILNLTAAQVANDTTALGDIVGPYTVNIVPAAATVSVADFLANQSTLDAAGYFTVLDQAQAVSQAFDSLNADWHVAAIAVADGMPLKLTVAQELNDKFALGAVGNLPFIVADTAANIAANFDMLVQDSSVSAVTLTDAGTPTLTLTAAKLFDDRQLFGEITNPQFRIAVVDTASNIAGALGDIDANPNVTSVTLTGSAPLVVWLEDWVNYASVISKITNPDLSITVLGAPYNATEIVAELDALNNDPRVSIELLFTPSLPLTAAQAVEDTAAFSKITGSYTITISDFAANVAAHFDALNSNANIVSIDLTDGGVPTLVLTAAQAQNDTNALRKIANAPFVLAIVGTGSETIHLNQPLQLSNVAYDASNGDWQVNGYGLADTLANVATVVDSNGRRFLLVGGGSDYTTAEAAVAAASDGDTILLTPGSDAGSVGTSGQAITIEDVGAVGSTPGGAPLVTITSPPEVTNSPSGGFFPNIITGKVVAYGTAIVAGQTVTLTDNGNLMATATVQADGTFSADVTFAYQGANAIVASVADSFGNAGTSAAVVDLLDSIPPTVTITSAAETSVVANQTISGIVTSGGIATVVGQTVFLSDNGSFLGRATVQSDGTFSASVTLPNQGENSIVASVDDSYGNFARSTAVVDTLDSIPPTVTIGTLAEASNNANQTIGIYSNRIGSTVTLTDNGSFLAMATIGANGPPGADGFVWVYVTLPYQGANALVATVTDSNGVTVSSAAVVDTLDNIAPALAFSSAPAPGITTAQTVAGSVTSGGVATVAGQTVTLSDNGNALGTATVQSDGTFSTSVTLPSQANNAILASVADSFGNTNNTYLATTGSGQIAITAQQGMGTTNDLDFTGDVTDQNLWFLQSGNDLKIDILGTNSNVTATDWFASNSNQFQEIVAGGLMIDSQISQLVQAMATYSANNAGFDPTSSSVHAIPNDAGLQNAVATAWHA